MASISIDPKHLPSNPQKSGNQGDGVRSCRKSNIPITHDLRKENIPISEEPAHSVDPPDPPTCPSHSSEIFRDISNADFGPSTKGQRQKGGNEKPKCLLWLLMGPKLGYHRKEVVMKKVVPVATIYK
ncbi:hypothetical protein FCV25MIE_05031 [Fagus crenata]